MLLIGVLLIVGGVVLIVINPLFGILPGVLLIGVGLVIAVLAFIGRSVSAIFGIGSWKTCPDCRTRNDEDALTCSRCGHEFG